MNLLSQLEAESKIHFNSTQENWIHLDLDLPFFVQFCMVLDHFSFNPFNCDSCFYNSAGFISDSLHSQLFRRDICALLPRIHLHKSVFPNETTDQNLFKKHRNYRALILEYRTKYSLIIHSWFNIVLHFHRDWAYRNNPKLISFNYSFGHRCSYSRISNKIDYISKHLLRWLMTSTKKSLKLERK